MSRIRSYIPEPLFLNRKDEAHMRLCREDFALVDPACEYRVIAGRGKDVCEGEVFAPIRSLPKSERDFLERALARHTRIFVQGQEGPILVFGELLTASGLCLVLCPRFDTESVRRSLSLLQRTEFVFSLGSDEKVPTPRNGDGAVCDYLQEVFYYLDRMLSASDEVRLWTSASLIANFAGCRADFDAMPSDLVSMLPLDRLRLSAFFLCLFLSVRQEAVAACAKGELSDEEVLIRVSPLAPTKEMHACTYRFLRLPAFADISLSSRDGSWVLEASFCRKSEKLALRAHDSQPIKLWMVFQCAC